MFEAMVDSRTIASGMEMEFPVTGTVDLEPSWDAGVELGGSSPASSSGTNGSKSTTFTVILDKRPMAAYFEVDNIDLMVTQWEYRSELARQTGLRLAYTRDKQIASFISRAAMNAELTANDPRATAPGVDPAGGTIFSNIGGTSSTTHILTGAGSAFYGDAAVKDGAGHNAVYFALGNPSGTMNQDQRMGAALLLLRDIEEFMVHLQEINAPTNGVVVCVTPRAFHDVRALGVARDAQSDLTGGTGRPMFGGVAEAGGLGVQLPVGLNGMHDTLVYMGATIYKSNHLPNVDYTVTANKIGETRYNLDGSDLADPRVNGGTAGAGSSGIRALMWQREAIASLSLQGLKVDTVDDIRRNTVFTVASMMKGTGILRPELCALCTADTIGSTAVDNNYTTAALYATGVLGTTNLLGNGRDQ